MNLKINVQHIRVVRPVFMGQGTELLILFDVYTWSALYVFLMNAQFISLPKR